MGLIGKFKSTLGSVLGRSKETVDQAVDVVSDKVDQAVDVVKQGSDAAGIDEHVDRAVGAVKGRFDGDASTANARDQA